MVDLALDLVFTCTLYGIVLLVLGVVARQARKSDSLSEHFLAGRSIAGVVLFYTFFASQYSGNSFSGFPGQIYREGLAFSMSVAFSVAIVAGYILFAPMLFRVSRTRSFITPTDFLQFRFGDSTLNYLSAVIFVIVLCNFLLAQLIAVGHAFSGLTGGQIPAWPPIVCAALVVLTYQALGGMRAVTWADTLNGTVMILGIVLLVGLLWREVGSPLAVMRTVNLLRPESVAPPDRQTSLVWLSNLVFFGLGAPLYPHAIQRIFAAKRTRDLRNALTGLAMMPIVATLPVMFIGVAGIALFPQVDRFAADTVTFRVVAYLVASSSFAYYPALVGMLAVIAAIVSTADSCLLSVTSILTKDIVARSRGMSDEQADRLTRVVPWISAGVMAVLVILAMRPVVSLWGLLVIKFEILIQLSPAFVLGTITARGDPRAFVASDIRKGLVVGLLVTLVLYLGGAQTPLGIQAGVIGVGLNYLIVWGARRTRLAAGGESDVVVDDDVSESPALQGTGTGAR